MDTTHEALGTSRKGTNMTCDCGHDATPSGSTTGYGRGIFDGKTYCFACCTLRDIADLRAKDRVTHYLSDDCSRVINWPGDVLMTVTARWQTSAGGFARRTTITRVRAIDNHGQRWSGRGPGAGMYLHLRKLAKGTK